MTLVGFIAVFAFLAVIPASIAGSKGYSFIGFFLLSVIALPIALVVALVISDRSAQVAVGSVIAVRQSIELNDGREIPARYVSKVHAVEPADRRVAVLITAPDGSRRWVDRANVKPA